MDAAAISRDAPVLPRAPTDRAAPALPGAPTDPAAVAAAAQSFEAVFIGQMLEPMFATVNTAHGPFGGGAGEEAWKPMLVDAVAKQIAAAGGFGFAAAVRGEMLRMQEARQG